VSDGGDFGVNLYGASYHVERREAKARNVANEFNPGLGVRYRRRLDARFDAFVDAGAYRDSGRNTALIAGPGLLWKPGGDASGWRLGGALAFVHSDTYNRGRAFIAPFPVLAYEWRSVTVNMTFIPKVSEVNDINTFGFWVTFFPQ
jgi:hypothetical protein